MIEKTACAMSLGTSLQIYNVTSLCDNKDGGLTWKLLKSECGQATAPRRSPELQMRYSSFLHELCAQPIKS